MESKATQLNMFDYAAKQYNNQDNSLSQSNTPKSNNVISFKDGLNLIEQYKDKNTIEQNRVSKTFTVNKPVIDETYLANPPKDYNPCDALSKQETIILLRYLYNTPSRYKGVNIRNYLYVVMTANISRRAGDMLSLKISDVLNPNGEIKTHINFQREQKTKKHSKILLNRYCQEALQLYFNNLGTYRISDWLFPQYKDKYTPVSVNNMRKMILKSIEKILKLHPEYIKQGLFQQHYATHSLRKVKARDVLDNEHTDKDVELVSEFLCHSNIETTYRYLNIRQDDLDEFTSKYGIGLDDAEQSIAY